VIRGHGGKTKHTYRIINAKAVEIPAQSIDRIKNNPRVAYVEEDAEVYILDAELDNSWGVKRIGAGEVHDSGNTGAGVKVAIIDTGIDYNHPELNSSYKGGYDLGTMMTIRWITMGTAHIAQESLQQNTMGKALLVLRRMHHCMQLG